MPQPVDYSVYCLCSALASTDFLKQYTSAIEVVTFSTSSHTTQHTTPATVLKYPYNGSGGMPAPGGITPIGGIPPGGGTPAGGIPGCDWKSHNEQTMVNNLLLHILGTPFNPIVEFNHPLESKERMWMRSFTVQCKVSCTCDVTQDMAVPALPVTNGVSYKVKLGKSFSDRNNNAFHTISCKITNTVS